MFQYQNYKYSFRDSQNRLAIPKPCTDYMKQLFGYSGVVHVLWNDTPSSVRKTTTPPSFKIRLTHGKLVKQWRTVRHLFF